MADYLEEGLRVYALAYPPLANLIENDDDTHRWYGPVLEQFSAMPSVTVQLISGRDEAGTQQGHSGLERARVQLTVWSTCPRKRVELTLAIKRRFDTGGRVSMEGIEVQYCKPMVRDLGLEAKRNLYQRVVELDILYKVVA